MAEENNFVENFSVMLNVLMNDMIYMEARRKWWRNFRGNVGYMLGFGSCLYCSVTCAIHHFWFWAIVMFLCGASWAVITAINFKIHNMDYYMKSSRDLFFQKADWVRTHLGIENLINEVQNGNSD